MEKNTNSDDESKVVFLWLLSFIGKYILMPFLSIWAVNTLFHTDISFSFKNWAAVVILIIFLKISTEGIFFNFTGSPVDEYEEDDDIDEEILRKVNELNPGKSTKRGRRKTKWDEPP